MAKLGSMETYRQSINSVKFVKRNTSCIWWRLRTGLERLLLCGWTSVSILFFTLCILIIILITIQHNSTKLTDSVCVTRDCIKEAARILDYLDESVPPCHDFYQFACGKWLQSSPIPQESNSISSFSITQDEINHKLRTLLEVPIDQIDSRTVKNLKNMYNSCMNLTAIRQLGPKPLIKYLKQFGGWPVIEGELWDETKFNLIDLITKIRKSGFENRFIFTIKVAPDYRRNTKNTIFISEPIFSCLTNNELIHNSYKRNIYLDFMVDVSVLLGADEQKAELELREVIQLESLMANASGSSNSQQFLTVKELEAIAPMNWSQLINGLFSIDLKINESEPIIVSNIKNIKAISRIITDYQQNKKRVLANYILWKIVFQSIKTLDQSFGDIYNDFYLETRLLKRNTKRWKTCLVRIRNYMRTGLTSLYLTKDKDKLKKKILAHKIFETIRWSLNQKLTQNDWMDESTRFNAVHKMSMINPFIAFTYKLIIANKIDKFYDSLDHIHRNSFFENILKIQKWNLDTEYSKLRTHNDRNGWNNIVTAPEVNAYYSPTINGIKIPVWILNGIFFGANRPNYLNYGSLGWIIGHEMIHPFDNIGGRVDSKGNLRDWWDVDTKELFENKSDCFVKQYENDKNNTNYPKTIREKSRLSENMADNGGIQIAFQSYKRFVETNGQELPLPGLRYSSEQLFWISAAQIWCSKLSPKAMKYFLQNSIHSLSEKRVEISFSNSEEFSKLFKCNETDRMNPKHKCKVW